MQPTPPSLLQQLRAADEVSWSRFVSLYTPLLRSWVRREGLQDADAEDLVQDVLLKVSEHLGTFDRQREGSFRRWLKTLCRNRYLELVRRKRIVPSGELDDAIAPAVEQFWEVEYRQKLIHSALHLMRTHFQESTWKACWEQVINDRDPAELAVELGISVESAYSARSRVLKRLRAELDGLLD